MGIEEVVDGKAKEVPEPVVEAPSEVVETPEAVVEAPAVVETPAPEVVEAPVVEAKPDRDVPLPTFLDMRDRATAAERRLAEAEKSREAPKVPDPYDDPKGYDAHIERMVDAKTTNVRFNMSDAIAKQVHGADAVVAATEWAVGRAEKDPTFSAQYMREAHPIDWIVRQHKRDSLVGQLPEDVSSLDELVDREIAKRGLNAAAPVAVEQQQAPATPARSIASQPSTGGGIKDVPLHPLAALEATFVR